MGQVRGSNGYVIFYQYDWRKFTSQISSTTAVAIITQVTCRTLTYHFITAAAALYWLVYVAAGQVAAVDATDAAVVAAAVVVVVCRRDGDS